MYTARILVFLLCQVAVTFGAIKPPRVRTFKGPAISAANAGSRLTNNQKPTSISAPSLSLPTKASMTITPPPRTAASSILAAPKSAWDPAGKELALELSEYFLGSDNDSAITTTDTGGSSSAEVCDGVCTTCALALETFSLCASVSGDAFVSGNADQVATCLCNDWIDGPQTYSWVGPQFDTPYSSCVQYVQTEGLDPDVVSSWSSMNGFCSKISASYFAQRAIEATATETGSSSSTMAPNSAGSGVLEVKRALVSGISETLR